MIKKVPTYDRCLVVDSNYMSKQVISSERAFVIWFKGNAEIISNHDVYFKLVNPDLQIKKPSIIKIKKYVNYYGKAALNRENIFKRDNYTCAYCPEGTEHKRDFLTIDHIIPKSKGGKDTWENLITACKGCNNLKADLSLKVFKKDFHVHPKKPHHLMMLKNVGYIYDEWKPYLFM